MKTKTKSPKKLTKPEMRVAIAKDAIAQIKAKRIIVNPGSYLRISGYNHYVVEKGFFNNGGKCQVCQIGQAIVCGINRFNNGTAYDNRACYDTAINMVKAGE